MELNLEDLKFKHKNIPCVIVGAGHTMLDFDYSKFKGIVILGGTAILRINKNIKPNYLVSGNNHFPVVGINKHIKILNQFKNMTWLMSDTACYGDIWKLDKSKYKKLKINHFFFDDRHFKRKKCSPEKGCCNFLDIYPKRKTIYEYLSDIYKSRFNLKNTSITAAENSLTFALLLGCNPIFIQGVDIPKYNYKAKVKGKKYFGKANIKADKILDETLSIIGKKYFFYYLKNLNFSEWIKSFKEKLIENITNRSRFFKEFKLAINFYNWLSGLAIKRKVKIFYCSEKSNLKEVSYFKYISIKNIKKKYPKIFKKI